MNPSKQQKIHYEEISLDVASSFTLREFRWPQFPFNWHYHPELELILIEKGTGLRFVGDSVEEFGSGDFCLIGSNTPHCWASHSKIQGDVCSRVIQFLPDFLGEAFLKAPEMRAVSTFLKKARRGIAIHGALQRTASKRITALAKHPEGSAFRLNAFLGILGELAESPDTRPLATADYEPLADERSGKKLARVLGFIHANLGSDLDQRLVANVIGISPQAFSRFFKQAMGKPYVAYVNELKIYKACRALIETDASITEVAFASGFNNLSNFNDQFRRQKKMTPRAYRSRVPGSQDKNANPCPPTSKV